ncbi:MAG: hypothetical protein ABIK68_05730 [bacterium]
MRDENQQTALRTRVAERNRKVDLALGLSRGDPVPQKEYTSPFEQGRFAMIGRLESSVSKIQTATIGVEKIKGLMSEMKRFLEEEGYRSFRAQIPVSVINNFLTDRLAHMKMTSETTSFAGRALLNGKSGVRGSVSGKNLRFIRGSARVQSSGENGYPIAVYQAPRPSVLTGAIRLSPEELRRESMIALADESREVRYRVRPDENPDSLVMNLQRYLVDNNFDISVYCTQDNHLFFRHNQLGSANSFRGMSAQSRLISEIPGHYREAEPGADVTGTIGSEQAHGEGGFLIGNRGNPHTEGLVVYFDGMIETPGQIVGSVHIEQNGIRVPVDLTGSKVEILAIPSIQPEMLAVGVSNRSGFTSLRSIRANTVLECRDALKLIGWSMTYLDYLLEELKYNEANFVDRAVEVLRSTMRPQAAGEEILYLSKDKARSMVDELKSMLTPAMTMKVTSWH